MRISSLFILLGLTVLPVRARAFDMFGGSCASQGAWTASALNQTEIINRAIETLAQDPNCKGIETKLPLMDASSTVLAPVTGSNSDKANELETLPGQTAALDTFVRVNQDKGGPLVSQATGTLAQKALELAALPIKNSPATAGALTWEQLKRRLPSAASYTLSFLDQTMEVLPSYQQCMNRHPNEVLAIIGAATQLMGAVSSDNQGLATRVGTTIGRLVTFMRQMAFAKIKRGLTKSRYLSSLSCLLESTAQSYCEVNEAYKILDYQSKEWGLLKGVKRGDVENPLSGYFLIARDLPVITDWIDKVQYGVTPQNPGQSLYKNSNLASYFGLQQTVNIINGQFGYDLNLYRNGKTLEQKKALALAMIQDMVGLLANNGGSNGQASTNFFTTNTPQPMIPYRLIGLDQMPEQARPDIKQQNKQILDYSTWMQNGMAYQPIFNDPDHLVMVIRQNLDRMINQALESGSAYFRRFFFPDNQDLTNQIIAVPSVSVLEGLKNIRAYVYGLMKKIEADPKSLTDPMHGRGMIPSMVDTLARIDRVLDKYNTVQKKVAQITQAADLLDDANTCPPGTVNQKDISMIADLLKAISGEELDPNLLEHPSRLGGELQRRINELYANVVSEAYDQFNVMLQQNGFLSSRVSTYVLFDYSQRLRNNQDMTPYLRQIMAVAGRGLLDKIENLQHFNSVPTSTDLANASMINRANLKAVDRLFSDDLFLAINDLNRKHAGGPSLTPPTSFDHFPKSIIPKVDHNGDLLWTYRPLHDDNQAYDQVRSKLCIQSLSFDDWERFAPLCTGSVLRSPLQSNDSSIDLNTSYDELARQRRKLRSNEELAPYVCAFRNHIQKNQVYWITTQSTAPGAESW